MYGIYRIQQGDTIDSLSKKYGVSPEILKNLNQNSNFEVGTNIIVPTMNEYFEIYTIDKGDNLYNIAKRYNTDYNLLALLNGLNVNDYIYPGNSILVPKRDVKYYFTKKNDSLNSVSRILDADVIKLLRENKIYYIFNFILILFILL